MSPEPECISTYAPSGRGFVVAVVLLPVFVSAALPFLHRSDDAVWLVAVFIGLPLVVLVGLGSCLHGYSFQFDVRAGTLTIEPRLALLWRLRPLIVPLAHITALRWEEDTEGGCLLLECESQAVFAITSSRRKAEQIQCLVGRGQPNLVPARTGRRTRPGMSDMSIPETSVLDAAGR